MPAELKVQLIASTMVGDVEAIEGTPFDDREPNEMMSEWLVEFAGRACYESWEMPNPATATNTGYLANITKMQHWSVFEHANFTFYIEGVSRSLTHELVRHNMAFSQLSQRYVDHTDMDYVIPPLYQGEPLAEDRLKMSWKAAIVQYSYLYEESLKKGASKKQAAEAARAVLPGMAETKIVVTADARDWRFFLERRLSPTADKEIQAVAAVIREQLLAAAPNLFQGV